MLLQAALSPFVTGLHKVMHQRRRPIHQMPGLYTRSWLIVRAQSGRLGQITNMLADQPDKQVFGFKMWHMANMCQPVHGNRTWQFEGVVYRNNLVLSAEHNPHRH